MRSLAAALALLACASAPSARAEEEISASRANVNLVGTVVRQDAARSFAVLEEGGNSRVVKIGGDVGGARLERVERDGILLRRAGRLERIMLASYSRSASSVPASAEEPADSSASAAGARARPGAREARARASASRPAAVLAAKGKRASALDPALAQSLARQARFVPQVGEEGLIRGIALLDVQPDSALARAGFQNGDLLVSINGVSVENTAAAYDALNRADPNQGGPIGILRGGRPQTIVIAPGAFALPR